MAGPKIELPNPLDAFTGMAQMAQVLNQLSQSINNNAKVMAGAAELTKQVGQVTVELIGAMNETNNNMKQLVDATNNLKDDIEKLHSELSTVLKELEGD